MSETVSVVFLVRDGETDLYNRLMSAVRVADEIVVFDCCCFENDNLPADEFRRFIFSKERVKLDPKHGLLDGLENFIFHKSVTEPTLEELANACSSDYVYIAQSGEPVPGTFEALKKSGHLYEKG